MIGALLITLREGLEAALIIGIILAYLGRTGSRDAFKYVWAGTGLGVAASVIVGAIIYFTAGELEGAAEAVFEGAAMFVAAGLLTWMILWMRGQAAQIRENLQAQVDTAMGQGSPVSLVLLAFVAVAREGIETVLFLLAATRVAESALSFISGGIIGLAAAIVLGYTIYKGTSRLNLKTFFNVTSVLLILFAAGLVAHGIHEFHEAGIIPTVVDHVWDTNNVLPEKETLGRFLTAILGYNANPSLVEVAAYLGYLIVALAVYFRPSASRGKKREVGSEKREATVV